MARYLLSSEKMITKGQKVDSVISFTKLFNTNLFELEDFASQNHGHENEV